MILKISTPLAVTFLHVLASSINALKIQITANFGFHDSGNKSQMLDFYYLNLNLNMPNSFFIKDIL